ncbi:MAG: response regulator [Vicinamibacterales bacterium]|nr:response regulator [Vicinamibacterales bacterium]
MTDDLRRRAEQWLRELEGAPRDGAPATEAAGLVHDLRVHQIELEMQNEELRRAQVEIETSRARYFDLYDLAPVAYFTIGEHGLIQEANLTAARLLGVDRGTLVGQPFTRFIERDEQDRYYLHRRRLFATGAPQVLDLRMTRPDGTAFWARLETTTDSAAGDAIEACRVVVSDISEAKRLEEERRQIEREFQQIQKVESLGRMAGAIAHLFNNQLGVVMGNLELSLDEPSTRQICVHNAMAAAHKATTVSRLLLTYLGQSSGSHAPLDLAEVCRASVPLLNAVLPPRVALHTDLPVPGPAVNGNASQIQLLLTNLVTNAWESAGDQNATVRVSLAAVPASEISGEHRFPVGWNPRDQDYACLTVTDTGCGIEALEIEKIFDPFFTSKFTGRGLGLAVALGVLHAHSGGVVVRSHIGRDSGSEFRVYLPVSFETVPRTAPAVDPAPAAALAALAALETGETDGTDGTILLVEDDEALRWATRQALERLGFRVLEARDGTEAVGVFRQHQPLIRLILCDVTMPLMGGWDTLEAVRRLSPDIPVVLTSGYDEAHIMADDRPERPQGFLAKPYTREALDGAIRAAMGRHTARE